LKPTTTESSAGGVKGPQHNDHHTEYCQSEAEFREEGSPALDRLDAPVPTLEGSTPGGREARRAWWRGNRTG
jgi:hypothetical protein